MRIFLPYFQGTLFIGLGVGILMSNLIVIIPIVVIMNGIYVVVLESSDSGTYY